ncbi:hypothetical protein B0J17DRAFT_751855 [Rhizoctonia solani]|nr:hypothetical protein B0J17DRAFT_751855 [Rhizoctonia solani]
MDEMKAEIRGRASQFYTVNIRASSTECILETFLESGLYVSLSELSLYNPRLSSVHDRIPPDYLHTIYKGPLWVPFINLLGTLSALRVNGTKFHRNYVSFSDRLVELRLQKVVVGRNSTLAGLLNSAPSLQDLKLVSVTTFPDLNQVECNIALRNLQTFILEDLYFNTLEFLLQSTTASSYQLTLYLAIHSVESISLDEPEPEPVGIEDICIILWSKSINTLFLSYDGGDAWKLTGSGLHKPLQAIPFIKILKIRGWCFDSGEREALKRPQLQGAEVENRDLFPEFEQLYLTSACIIDQEAIKDTVTSHPIKKMVLGGNLRYQGTIHPISGHEQMPDEHLVGWLQSNVPDFPLLWNYNDPPEFHSDVWQLW